MAFSRAKKEKNPETTEEMRGHADLPYPSSDAEVQCPEKKLLFEILKVKIKNFMKSHINSKPAASLTEVDHNIIENDVSTGDSPGDPHTDGQKQKHKMKITERMKMDFFKRQKNSKSAATLTPLEKAKHLDFHENLEQNRLVEAQKQLVEAEEQLFGSDKEARAEVEEDKLQADCEILLMRLRLVIYDSFNEDNHEVLKSALTCILQEEARDKYWEKVDAEKRPMWRPTKCREIHDTLLQAVVEERMKNADEQANGADKLSTSLKREVCCMGKQVQKDLLRVVKTLQEFYPPDFDICRIYAQLYHQAFSTRLQELAKSSIDFEEVLYILNWIVKYYPRDVLKHKELEDCVSKAPIGPLLPEEDLKMLEEQYFSYREREIEKWLSNALEKEVKKWNDGKEPELMDGYYHNNLAIDVIPLVDVTVTEVKEILGCEKAQHILHQQESFLKSYRKSLEELVKTKQNNVPNTLSANLVSIDQFREYAQREGNPLTEETKTALLSTLADLKNLCHKYFLSRIYTELKPLYRKVWTRTWFTGHIEVVDELLKALEYNLDNFRELKPVCREELLGELHFEVMIEYVRRMMKRKLKLKDKEEQEAAAEFICQDSNKICSLFVKVGSKEEWLSQILPKLSEILKLQDPGSLQLEIVTLARVFPDLSEQHVLAILNLKTNLGSSDLRRIKQCLNENRDALDDNPSPLFFSKVPVKRKIL